MGVDALNEDIGQLIVLVGLQVDFVGGLLAVRSLFIFQFLLQVQDFVVTAFDERVVVPLNVIHHLELAFARRDQVFDILLQHCRFLDDRLRCLPVVELGGALFESLVCSDTYPTLQVLSCLGFGVRRVQVGLGSVLLRNRLHRLTCASLVSVVE